MLLREVEDNPGLLRNLVRVREYTHLYATDSWDGVTMRGMIECSPGDKYWRVCVDIQDERRIASKNTTWVYAIIKLSEDEIKIDDKKHEEWENIKDEGMLKQFYNKYPPTKAKDAYKDHEVVRWCTDPPLNDVTILMTNCECAASLLPVDDLHYHHMHCKRCDGNWKHCDKMSDKNYLMKFDKEELVEIIEELSR